MGADFLKSSWLEYIYPMLCIFVPCIIYQILLIKKRKTGAKVSIKHLIWTWVFMLYLMMALKVSGGGTIWDIGRYGDIVRTEEISLIPFQSDGVLTYLLNIIMFMPLGFLIPLIWKKYRRVWPVLLAGAGFSLAIEVGQLFNRRVTDIDDLLMNTIGAMIGYGIWYLFKSILKNEDRGIILSDREPVMYLFLSFTGTFLLFNPMYFVNLFYFT